jgi:hypothetical protein
MSSTPWLSRQLAAPAVPAAAVVLLCGWWPGMDFAAGGQGWTCCRGATAAAAAGYAEACRERAEGGKLGKGTVSACSRADHMQVSLFQRGLLV